MSDQDKTRASLLFNVSSLDRQVQEMAWQELYEKYYPMLQKWALSRGLDAATAEEAATDVLYQLVISLPKFRYDPSVGSFRGYLSKILGQRIGRQQRVKNQEANVTQSHFQSLVDNASGIETLVDALVASDQTILKYEAIMRVRERKDVTDTKWQVWYLSTHQAMPGKQIAAELGLSLQNVYQIKKRVNDLIVAEFEKINDD